MLTIWALRVVKALRMRAPDDSTNVSRSKERPMIAANQLPQLARAPRKGKGLDLCRGQLHRLDPCRDECGPEHHSCPPVASNPNLTAPGISRIAAISCS